MYLVEEIGGSIVIPESRHTDDEKQLLIEKDILREIEKQVEEARLYIEIQALIQKYKAVGIPIDT